MNTTKRLLFLFLTCGPGAHVFSAERLVIQYHGHSCFTITSPSKAVVLMDPFGADFKYALPTNRPGLVCVSHEHHDHNNVNGVTGFPIILHGVSADGKNFERVDFSYRDIRVTNLSSHHDSQGGQTRGFNSIFVLDIRGFRIVHLGDLGDGLTEEQIKALQGTNVLLLPVGGNFTIDSEKAAGVVKALKPTVTIPMHYKTPVTSDVPISSIDGFSKLFPDAVNVGKSSLEIDISKPFPKPGVYILDYQPPPREGKK